MVIQMLKDQGVFGDAFVELNERFLNQHGYMSLGGMYTGGY